MIYQGEHISTVKFVETIGGGDSGPMSHYVTTMAADGLPSDFFDELHSFRWSFTNEQGVINVYCSVSLFEYFVQRESMIALYVFPTAEYWRGCLKVKQSQSIGD